MANITLLPSAKVPLVYDGENTMTTEWYRFFWNIYGFTAAGTIPVSKGGTGLDTIGNHQIIIGNTNNVFEPASLLSASIAITYPAGYINLELSTSGVTVGTYGSTSQVGVFTVNQYGVLTAASNASIAINANQITSGTIASARISGSYTGITGVGTLTAGTWNATTIGVANGGTGLTSLTQGYIPFGTGTTAFSSSANLFWDSTNNRLGVGTATPATPMQVSSSGNTELSVEAPSGSPLLSLLSNSSGSSLVVYTQNLRFGSVTGAGLAGYADKMQIGVSGGVSIGNTTDKGAASLNVSGLIYPQQAATASAPTYAKGAIYFDTTLNKLRVGGATAWETITSV